jgi:phage tail sheath protein FI
MASILPTFGLSFVSVDDQPLPVVGANMDVIGIIGPCSTADLNTFPYHTPVLMFSNDLVMLAKLRGTAPEADGFIADAIDGINAQLADYQIAAQLVIVNTPYGTSEVSEAIKLQQTIAHIMGSSALGTGIYAFMKAPNSLYCTPRIIVAPGYTGQMANSLDTLVSNVPGVGYIPNATYQVTFAQGEGELNGATLVLPIAHAVADSNGMIDDAQIFIDSWGAWFSVSPTATLPPPDHAGAEASGSINFSVIPIATSTITIGTQALTLIAHGATPSAHQIALGTNLTTTIDAILAYLATQSGDPQIGQCDYAAIGGAGVQTGFTVSSLTVGSFMNGFGLATTDGAGTVTALSGGLSDTAGAATGAVGQIMFQAMPGIGAAINFNGTNVTFIAHGATPSGHQVALGLALSDTVDNLVTYLMGGPAQGDGNIGLCTYVKVVSTLVAMTIQTKAVGVATNGFTLSSTVTGAILPPTLTGGMDAEVSTQVTLTATMALGANPVVANMGGVLDGLIAHAIVESSGTSMIADENWRDTINHERIIPVSGGCKIIDPISGDVIVMPISGRYAGLMVAEDFRTGWPFHSFANRPVQGIVGPARTISFSLTDGSTEGQVLLAANLGILVRGLIGVETAISSGGFNCICTDNAGDNPLWQFYNVKRGSDYINLSLMPSLRVFLGRTNITKQTIVNILATINNFLAYLQAAEQILGFKVNFQGSLNTVEQIRLGRLTVGYQAEPPPVLRRITTMYARYAPAIDAMVADVQSQLNSV